MVSVVVSELSAPSHRQQTSPLDPSAQLSQMNAPPRETQSLLCTSSSHFIVGKGVGVIVGVGVVGRGVVGAGVGTGVGEGVVGAGVGTGVGDGV